MINREVNEFHDHSPDEDADIDLSLYKKKIYSPDGTDGMLEKLFSLLEFPDGFTPFFVQAGTTWTMTMLAVCWAVTAIAMWKKITDEQVKSRWSTASYFGLGAIGLLAIPDLKDVPMTTLWAIFAGCASYAIGTIFYARKDMPYRYATWHTWVNFGGISMFVGIWLALFSVA